MTIQIIGMFLTALTSIAVALITSNGFWNRLEKRTGISPVLNTIMEEITSIKQEITSVKQEVDSVKKSVEALDDKVECKEANQSRNRIVRFNDELLQNVKHSQEGFNLILDDITEYEQYCLDHPNYPNSKATEAIKHIKYCYRLCEQQHDFI